MLVRSLVVVVLALASGMPLVATAQGGALPKEIAGRWSAPTVDATETFSLNELAATSSGGFTARLTWLTSVPNCALRNLPITGKLTPTGISFEAKTRCDMPFAVELDRAADGWVGKGRTTGAVALPLELRAK
jgi:hypothetical protein